MIERVARAIEDCHDKDTTSPYEQIGHEVALECARAAIAAMREASNSMCEIGTDARWKSPIRDANNVREIWRSMIDDALTEPEAPAPP